MSTAKVRTVFKNNYGGVNYRIERREAQDPENKRKTVKRYWIYENSSFLDDQDNFGEAVFQMLVRAGQLKSPGELQLQQ